MIQTARPVIRRLGGSPLARSVAQTFGSRVAGLAIGLVTSVIVARALGPVGRGELAVAAAASQFGIYFLTFGLHTANAHFVARDRGLLRRMMANSLLAGVVIGGIGGLITTIVVSQLSESASLGTTLGLIVVLSVPFGVAFTLVQHLLLGLADVRGFNLAELSVRVVSLGAIGALVIFDRMSAASAMAASLLGSAVAVLWVVRRLAAAPVGGVARPDLRLARPHLRYGVRAYLASVLAFLVLRSDVIIISRLLGAEDTGLYAAAAASADLTYLLPAAAAAVLFPRLSALDDRAEQWRLTRAASWGISATSVASCALLALLAGRVLELLYGQAFVDARPALQWLCLAMVPYGINSILSSYLAAIGSPASMILVWFVGAVVNIALNLVLVPEHGLIGSAAASAIAYTAVLLGNLVIAHRSLSWPK